MGVTKILAFLRRHKRVALDTSVFIYQLQSHPQYSVVTRSLFSWVEQPTNLAVTSTITLAELMVQPIRHKDENLVSELFGLLTRYPNLEWVPVSVQIAALAARYRAEYGLKMPDALQAATCVYSQVPAMITNDVVFRRIPEIDSLILDDLL